MIFAVPVFGWIIGFLLFVLLSIPSYFLWNYVAPIYFTFLPPVWMKIPFWDMVWLFCVFSILKAFVFPNFGVSIKNRNGNK